MAFVVIFQTGSTYIIVCTTYTVNDFFPQLAHFTKNKTITLLLQQHSFPVYVICVNLKQNQTESFI